MTTHCTALEANVRRLYKSFPNFELATPVHVDLLCAICNRVSVSATTHPRDEHFRCTVCLDCGSATGRHLRQDECEVCRAHLGHSGLKKEDFADEMIRVWVCCPADKKCGKLYPIGEMLDHVKKEHPRDFPGKKMSSEEPVRRDFDNLQGSGKTKDYLDESTVEAQRQIDSMNRRYKEQKEEIERLKRELEGKKREMNQSSGKLSQGDRKAAHITSSYQDDLKQLAPPDYHQHHHRDEVAAGGSGRGTGWPETSSPASTSYEKQPAHNPDFEDAESAGHHRRTNDPHEIGHGRGGDGGGERVNRSRERSRSPYGGQVSVAALTRQYDGTPDTKNVGHAAHAAHARNGSETKLSEMSSWKITLDDYAALRARQRELKHLKVDKIPLNGSIFSVEIYADGFPVVTGKFVSVRVRLVHLSTGAERKSAVPVKLILRVGDKVVVAHEGILKVEKALGESYVDFRQFVYQDILEQQIAELKSKVTLEVSAKI